MKNKSKLAAGRIVTAVLTVIVLVLLVYIVYLFTCNIDGRAAFVGNRAMLRVISPSMEPDIPTGSYILIEKIDPDSLNIGDVITFKSKDPTIYDKLNTHRIISINDDGSFVTQGTANEVADEYSVAPETVVGKYVKNVEFITRISKVLGNKAAYFILIIIPAVILLGLCVSDVIKKAKKARFDIAVDAEIKRLLEADAEKDNKPTDEGCDNNDEKIKAEETNKETSETN